MQRYAHFIQNIALENPGPYQPVFSITGNSDLTEHELDLQGYMNNKPVRIGNGAYTQIQNDVYGQILLSLLPLFIDHRFINRDRLKSLKLYY